MNGTLMFLTPLLALLILAAVFGFSGCGVTLPLPEDPPPEEEPKPEGKKKPWEQGVVTPPPTSVVGQPPPDTYEEIVQDAPGFAAFWPLNETGGNIAAVVGTLNPAANGIYRTVTGAPPGTGLKLGDPGVLSHKDATDFSPSFDGSAGYVEVPFMGQLNPAKMVTGFTIELWVKPNPALGADTQVVLSSHRVVSATNEQGYEIALVRAAGQANQQVRARLYNNTATPGEVVVLPLQGDPTEWRQIVMTYRFSAATGGSVSVYVRLAKSAGGFIEGPFIANYEPVVSTASTTLRFGAGHGVGQGLANFFAGQIDNVAFYNSALGQGEIDKHFNMF